MREVLLPVIQEQRGTALLMSLVLTGVLGVLVAAYALAVRSDTVLRGGAARERLGFYAAEAGLNKAMAEVRQFFKNLTPPGDYRGSLIIGPSGRERTVEYEVAPVPGRSPAPLSTIPAGWPFAGLVAIPHDYTVTSVAYNGMDDREVTLGGQFTINTVPLFQFLAFYEEDLELIPCVNDMDLHGRIHTNKDLYIDGCKGITVGDARSASPDFWAFAMTAGSEIYRGRKDTSVCTDGGGGSGVGGGGAVTLDTYTDDLVPIPDLDPADLLCVSSSTTLADEAALATFTGAVKSGTEPILVPAFFNLERGGGGISGGVYWQRADLRIVLNLTAARMTNFCGATLPVGNGADGLYSIEVQNPDGSLNTTKTTALHQSMCERRGSIFYNDIPQTLPAAMPVAEINSDAETDPSNPDNYAPPFAVDESNFHKRAARVYRRGGEDTNGDGTIDTNGDGTISNNDRNDDICPIDPAGGARPSWRPDFCDIRMGNWPNTVVPTDLRTSWYLDNDYRRGGFYNSREQAWVMMLSINVRALIDWNAANNTPLFPQNDTSDDGLILFFSVQASDSTTEPPPTNRRYGVRVFDSAKLDTQSNTLGIPSQDDAVGLTIASDQALYVEGNYNYIATLGLGDKWAAALLADTINLLSQSWEVPIVLDINKWPEEQYNNDRKSAAALAAARTVQGQDGYYVKGTGLTCATAPCSTFARLNTYGATAFSGIQAAFLGGTESSTVGQYNGGIENFVRLHENWGAGAAQQTLWYRGSFVSLGSPKFATGQWCDPANDGCDHYGEPTRNWDYDATFESWQRLPPLSPKADILTQKLLTRFYQ